MQFCLKGVQESKRDSFVNGFCFGFTRLGFQIK